MHFHCSFIIYLLVKYSKTYTSSLPLESQNFAPYLSLYTSVVRTSNAVIQKRCSLKSSSIVSQFINLNLISISPSHDLMLQNVGMICHWKKPICFRNLFLSFSGYRKPMTTSDLCIIILMVCLKISEFGD